MKVAGRAGPNVFFPGEKGTFTLRISSKSSQPLRALGRIEVIQYGTRGRPGDPWSPEMFRIRNASATSFSGDVPVGGSQISHRLKIASGNEPAISRRAGY